MKMMKKPDFKLLAYLAAIIFAVFAFLECKRAERAEISSNNQAELLKQNELKLIDAELGIYQSKQIRLQQEKTIQELLDSIKGISQVETVTKVVTKTEIKEVFVPFIPDSVVRYIERLETNKIILPQEQINLPRYFSHFDSAGWYSMSGEVQRDGILFKTIKFKNDFYVVTGKTEQGLFKRVFGRPEYVVQYRDMNPYSSVQKLENVTITPPKQRFGYGLQAGYGITQFGPSWYMGVGINIRP